MAGEAAWRNELVIEILGEAHGGHAFHARAKLPSLTGSGPEPLAATGTEVGSPRTGKRGQSDGKTWRRLARGARIAVRQRAEKLLIPNALWPQWLATKRPHLAGRHKAEGTGLEPATGRAGI